MGVRTIILRQPGRTSTFPGAEVREGRFWYGFTQVTGLPESESRHWAFLCKTTDFLPERANVEDALLRWLGRSGKFVDGERVDGVITLEADPGTVYGMLADNPWLSRLRTFQLAIPGEQLRRTRGDGHRISTFGALSVAVSRLGSDPSFLRRVFQEAGQDPRQFKWRQA